jgi:heptosyltransferase-2
MTPDKPDTPDKIVIRGPNWIGDAILGVPAMKAVRERFPAARITLLVRPWVAGLFHSAPFIDEVWTRPRPGATEWIKTAREMRRRRFDIALMLPNSFESALTTYLGGVPDRVGYATDRRGWLLNRSVERPRKKMHQVDYYLNLVDVAFDSPGRPDIAPDIAIAATEEELSGARRLLADSGIDATSGFLVVNPGAAFGSAKRWNEERFAAVADRLAGQTSLQVVMIGSESERPIAERIKLLMDESGVVLNGRTDLETLVGVLAQASLMITNDSGPMHMAAALGVRTVAIFGSTDAEVTSPVGPRTRVVHHEVSCSPCLLRECPIDHRCMDAVTVDEVSNAAMELMNLTETGRTLTT